MIPFVITLWILFLRITLASQNVYSIGSTQEFLDLLKDKNLVLTPDPDSSVTTNSTVAPTNVPNNTVDYRDSAYTRRDTSWGTWNNVQLIIRWSTSDFMNSWNNGIRNKVADQAANRGWQAWWGWTAMNFHAQAAGDLKRDGGVDGFTVILPGILDSDLQLVKVDNAAYTYVYDPATAVFGIQTIRQSFFDDTASNRKRHRNTPAFNMAFTKVGGPSCGTNYKDFYGAAYHAAYLSQGSGLQMCGFISSCCNNGCETMQFQASNYKDGQWDLWGNCMDINRNAQWYNYGF